MTPRVPLACVLTLLACGGESVRHGSPASRGPPSFADFEPTSEPGAAVAYLTDPGHTSSQTGRAFAPPWFLEYGSTEGGAVSYPLIVGDRFFFTANGEVNHVANVHARYLTAPADDAWAVTPFTTGPEATSGHLAYDRGRIFVADGTGHVAALEATTGAIRAGRRCPLSGAHSVVVSLALRLRSGAVPASARTTYGAYIGNR